MSFANVAEQLGFCNSVILISYPFIGWITFEMLPRTLFWRLFRCQACLLERVQKAQLKVLR